MKNLISLLIISYTLTACQYNWPITTGYLITSDPAMSEAYESKFGFLLYDKDYTEYIAGSIKHVYPHFRNSFILS